MVLGMNNESILKIHTPSELLDAIPALIGFRPTDSLVAVVVMNKLIYVTARLDIEAIECSDGATWLAGKLTHDPDGNQLDNVGVYLVGYGEADRATSAVRAMCEQLGNLTQEALVVDGDKWWRLDDDQAHGHFVPKKGKMSRILAQDNPVMDSRDQLAGSVAAPTGAKEDQMLQLVIDSLDLVPEEDPPLAGHRLVELMEAWHKGTTVTDTQFLSAAMTVSMGMARDEVWKILTRTKAKEYLPFWKEVLLRTPHGVRTAALAVTGIIAWISGEGALMNICLEEAEATDPEYPLVDMLRHISLGCLPPSYWEKMNPGLCKTSKPAPMRNNDLARV